LLCTTFTLITQPLASRHVTRGAKLITTFISSFSLFVSIALHGSTRRSKRQHRVSSSHAFCPMLCHLCVDSNNQCRSHITMVNRWQCRGDSRNHCICPVSTSSFLTTDRPGRLCHLSGNLARHSHCISISELLRLYADCGQTDAWDDQSIQLVERFYIMHPESQQSRYNIVYLSCVVAAVEMSSLLFQFMQPSSKLFDVYHYTMI